MKKSFAQKTEYDSDELMFGFNVLSTEYTNISFTETEVVSLYKKLPEKKVFNTKASPQESQTLEVGERAWNKEDSPAIKEDKGRDHLGKLDTHKSMGPDGMHPRVLRELADVTAKPLSIIFERSWRTGEVPEDCRKANVMPVFKKVQEGGPGKL
ncbi:rna-directed dna polymerase from mobile element hypothetical protein [Limosa lapponica baueri]|uniref:Rna-directed dna polymerase from mobile element jockey-like n=1 Tax=Limosa lapponica baueri TaxID=1758121 RepID=A0A2I0TBQ1_LIMLA|nr:rna-directed dna polymerase from mobile element hypothetical protein [Limosa lapponica baueri]